MGRGQWITCQAGDVAQLERIRATTTTNTHTMGRADSIKEPAGTSQLNCGSDTVSAVCVCTCAGSTGHSGCLHSHRCIHGRSWASGGTEPHSHMDSGGRHQCSLSHSNLGTQRHWLDIELHIHYFRPDTKC